MRKMRPFASAMLPAAGLTLAAGLMLASLRASAQEPLFNLQDLRFLQHMSVHHEQALVMAELVPDRTDRPEFRRFADYVYRAQAAEIAQMQALIDLAEERGSEVHSMPLDGDPPMAGMLSSARMRALEESTGAEFERLWLEGMIYHHQGAIDMAEAQQAQQLENGRRPYGLAVLVEEIIVEQRAEITKMRDWLNDWGLVGSD
jgi:uncharacterized protein (DUF305 family)